MTIHDIWHERSGKSYTHDDLISYLSTLQQAFVVIEGPSMCGKSTLIRDLCDRSNKKSLIVSELELKELILALYVKPPYIRKSRYTVDEIKTNEIICFEDVDYLNRMDMTQEEAARILYHMSRQSLVIITGINLKNRIPHLLDRISRWCDVKWFDYTAS